MTTFDGAAAIERREFTFCSAYYGGTEFHEFLVMTAAKPEARERAHAYARQQWGDREADISLYPRRYVKDARVLYRQGKHDGRQ